MTFSREDDRFQLSVRVSDEMNQRLEWFADQHNHAKSEVVRRALDIHLPEDETTAPEDPDLRQVYEWLRDRSNDRNRIDAAPAISELSQRIGMKEEFVKSSRLEPLNRRGWIEPRAGTIIVLSPDEGADQ